MLFCRQGGTVERGDIHSDRKEFHSPEGHEDILAWKCSERLRMSRNGTASSRTQRDDISVTGRR
jgi:hypothetical protein